MSTWVILLLNLSDRDHRGKRDLPEVMPLKLAEELYSVANREDFILLLRVKPYSGSFLMGI
jgi:hypothetical protein